MGSQARDRGSTLARPVAALLVTALFVAGCSTGGGGEDGSGAPLLDFLDPESVTVGYVDAGAVTAGLGLDAADLVDGGPATRLWDAHVEIGLPIYRPPNDPPLAVVLDRASIGEAMAGPPDVGLNRQAVMAVRTDQPWDEIADALLGQGYQDRADGILTTDAAVSEVMYTAVGWADGVLVAGQDADAVAEAIERSSTGAGPEALGQLIAADDDPLRAATFLGSEGSESCGSQYAAVSPVPVTGGEWLVVVGPEAETERIAVEAGEEWDPVAGLRTGEPRLDGELLRVPLVGEAPRWDPEQGVQATALRLFFGTDQVVGAETSLTREYDCP